MVTRDPPGTTVPDMHCFRAVPRVEDHVAAFLTEKDLGVFLATIVPRSPELLEEVAYLDISDGSQISLRRDCVTFTPHVLCDGARAAEFHAWAMRELDCWTNEEIFAEADRQLSGADIDGIIDVAVVMFISAPPLFTLDSRWLGLAWKFFGHPDADVRDAALAGTYFRLWESPEVQSRVELISRDDPSEMVRTNAAVLLNAMRQWRNDRPSGA